MVSPHVKRRKNSRHTGIPVQYVIIIGTLFIMVVYAVGLFLIVGQRSNIPLAKEELDNSVPDRGNFVSQGIRKVDSKAGNQNDATEKLLEKEKQARIKHAPGNR